MWLLLRADGVQYRTDDQLLWQFFEYADHDHSDHKTPPHGPQQFVYRMCRMADRRIHCNQIERAELGCGVAGVLGDGVGIGIQRRYSVDCAYVESSSRRRALFQTRRHAGSRSWRGRARTRV